MLKTKKILSVILAFSLIFSVFTMSISALESGKTIGLVLTADKTEIKQGDTITITLHVDLNDYSTLMGTMRLALLFDSSVYTPDTASYQYLNEFQAYYNNAKAPAVNANFLNNTLAASTLTDAEKANYNAALMNQFQVLASANGGITEKMGYALTQSSDASYSVPEWQVTFNVTGDPAAGSTDIRICDGITSTTQYVKTTDGTKVTSHPASAVDVSQAFVAPTAASEAPAGPALNHLRREVKMTVENGAVVSGTEQLRVVSAISQKDWEDFFANTTVENAAENAIQEVGIVAYKGKADTFNVDTAKAAAQDPKTAAEGYSVASTDYIQHDAANSRYLFGARIQYKTEVFDTTYLAYVKYLDNAGQVAYAFYDTTTIYSLEFASNYDTITNGYINR